MDQEHDYRVSGFEALPDADDPAAEVVRILAGSDPALLRAMVEACGIDARLREFARDLRRETQERLAASLERARAARDSRSPAVDASTAAWATLALSDAFLERAAPEAARVINMLAFAETDGERIRV